MNALAGRLVEAREAMKRALEFDPQMRAFNLADRMGVFRPVSPSSEISAPFLETAVGAYERATSTALMVLRNSSLRLSRDDGRHGSGALPAKT